MLALAGRQLFFIDLPRARDLGPVLITWGLGLGVLVMQKDLGSSLLIFGTFIAMLYIATQRTSWVLIGIVLFVGGAILAGLIFSHVQDRFIVYLDPEDPALFDKVGGSAQLMQGLFAMANGGILGTGLGQGHPDEIPLAFSDFIFPATGEELGLTGPDGPADDVRPAGRSAACAPRSRPGTRSPSCWRAACRSSWPGRCSSSSAV